MPAPARDYYPAARAGRSALAVGGIGTEPESGLRCPHYLMPVGVAGVRRSKSVAEPGATHRPSRRRPSSSRFCHPAGVIVTSHTPEEWTYEPVPHSAVRLFRMSWQLETWLRTLVYVELRA